jgi:general secretion pathway protein J
MSLFLNKKYQSREGLTLIEILIAVAILSIILTALYSTFLLSQKAIEGMDESMLKLQESRKAIDILKRELDSAYYDIKTKDTIFKIQDKDFYGKQATQLTFTTFSTLRPGLSKISYYIEDNDKHLNLYKKIESPYSDLNTEGDDIIDDIKGFTIEAKYNNTWVKTWDTDINKNLPDEIRISLTVMIRGNETTIFDVSLPKRGKSI